MGDNKRVKEFIRQVLEYLETKVNVHPDILMHKSTVIAILSECAADMEKNLK